MAKKKNPLEKLKKDLYGHYPAVAEKFGCSASFVSHVLTGNKKSDSLVEFCIEYANALKSEKNTARENLQSKLKIYNEA